ncbi:TOMM precursor leader peptide-binding protein [Micromonospora sp. NPDC047074]|uniref:TOMM precursor leader peptide-binding protein n=1 Tax=Micromonospora sp. NPDC047074 TaxID=3154339 RepID=UPI0033FE09ED
MSGGDAQLRVGFKRHLRAHVVRGDAVYLLSERGATSVSGAHVEALAPLLDGSRDLAELVRDSPPGMTSAEIGTIVTRLVDAGLVTVRPAQETGADEPVLAYWESVGLDAATAVRATATARVDLITVGSPGATWADAAHALRGAGLTVAQGAGNFSAASPDLSIVICDDYLDEELIAVDAAHRAARRPWLLAKPGGAQVWVGPVFDPAAGAGCWHCLAHRLRGHRQAETRLRAVVGPDTAVAGPQVSIPPLGAAAVHLVALEAAKWTAGLRHDGQRAVWTLDSVTLRGRHHEVRARPQCPECGDPGIERDRAFRPVPLRSRPKAFRSGGSHRALPPERVLHDYGHLVSPVSGVVKEITRDHRGPAFLNSFRSGPNLAMTTRRNVEQMRFALRAENGGKGVTPLQAEVSALCEAVERHSAYFHGDEARVTGSYTELADTAVHPDDCLLFDERQYADRARWNATCSPFQYICAPFDDSAVTSWTPVWSLTERRHRLLPTSMLYFNVPEEHGGMSLCADSNGNAAGSSLEDALLQGLLEIVERDAVALWWYNRTQAPAVDLASFGDPWIDELREVYAGLHREVWVLDVTSDVGIPTMAALSRRTDKRCEDIMFGFGTHLDPRAALIRALTEMNQLLPTVAEVAGADDAYGWSDPDAVRWWRTATWAGDAYLRPDPTVPARGLADYRHTPADDLLDDVRSVQHRLEALGLDVLVLDQTRPDVGLPVVKAIVPGMRGFWARFAPGRLFDVPVKLGRLDRPTAYENLNPIPLFV